MVKEVIKIENEAKNEMAEEKEIANKQFAVKIMKTRDTETIMNVDNSIYKYYLDNERIQTT
jgi:hypothetical protein